MGHRAKTEEIGDMIISESVVILMMAVVAQAHYYVKVVVDV
jgi:hypothetical protein